jgi:hypothetical protein
MSVKGSVAGDGGEGGEGPVKVELTEEELAAALVAFNKFDVDRRGVRLCDLKKIYEAMGETLRDEEMFNVRARPSAPSARRCLPAHFFFPRPLPHAQQRRPHYTHRATPRR